MKTFNKIKNDSIEYIVKEAIMPINYNYNTPTRWQRMQIYEMIRYSWNDLKEQAESEEEYIRALTEALNGHSGNIDRDYSPSTQNNLWWFRYQLIFDDWHSLRGLFYSEKNDSNAQSISLSDIQNFLTNCILKELEKHNINTSNILTYKPHSILKNYRIGNKEQNLYMGVNQKQALLFEMIHYFKLTNSFANMNVKNKFQYSKIINAIDNFIKDMGDSNNEKSLLRILFIFYKETKYNRLDDIEESERIKQCIDECYSLLYKFKNEVCSFLRNAKLENEFLQLGYLSSNVFSEIDNYLRSGNDIYSLINKNNYNLLFYLLRNLGPYTVEKFIIPHILKNKFIWHDIAKHGCEIAIPELIKLGISINFTDAFMCTPLFEAIENGHEKIALLLIDNGASVNSVNVDKDTPLCLAIKQNSKLIVCKLIQAGANVNIKCNNDYSPLHLAVKNNRLDLVDLLLNANALINSTDIIGDTPLHLAVKNKNKNIIILLIENNANLLVSNIFSVTPLSMLVKPDLIEILSEATQNNLSLLALTAKELESKGNNKAIDLLLSNNKSIDKKAYFNMLFQYSLLHSAGYLLNELILKQAHLYLNKSKKYKIINNDLAIHSSFHCKKIFSALIEKDLNIARKYFFKLLEQAEAIQLYTKVGSIFLFNLLYDVNIRNEIKFKSIANNLTNKDTIKNLTTIIRMHYLFIYQEKNSFNSKGLSTFIQLLTAFKSKSTFQSYTLIVKQILNQYPLKYFQPGMYYNPRTVYSYINRLSIIPEDQLALIINEYFMYIESNNKNLPQQEQEFISYLKKCLTASPYFSFSNYCNIL